VYVRRVAAGRNPPVRGAPLPRVSTSDTG